MAKRGTTGRSGGRSGASRGKGGRGHKGPAPGGAGPASANVAAWEDDPMSGFEPVVRAVPDLTTGPLKFAIADAAAPAPDVYSRGTAEFRYWAAADALARGREFWAGVEGGPRRWFGGDSLDVLLDAGEDLNAYYDRRTLSFFHAAAGGRVIFSGESPDVVLHEMGHAVLDALRPQLFDAMSDEAAAFHESFGDMAAILVGLQLPSVRSQVLGETQRRLYRTSRLSRLAESLGWGIRQGRPDLVPPDCLRNAVNAFFYRPPDELPPSGPDAALTSEPHSFSRVFTGGFFEALANMVHVLAATPSEDDLQQASADMARLLVMAVRAAPVVPDYYAQVAAHLIEADEAEFDGKYADALRSALVRRGLLSLQAAAPLAGGARVAAAAMRPVRAMAVAGAAGAEAPAAGAEEELPRLSLSGVDLGLGERPVVVFAPGEPKRFAVTAAAVGAGASRRPDEARAARVFAEFLFRRGRVDVGEVRRAVGRRGAAPRGRGTVATVSPARAVRRGPGLFQTHVVVPEGEALVIRRRTFDCGFDA